MDNTLKDMPNVSDIKIFKNGQWLSLRGQKVYAGNAWREFKTGCGIRYGGQWHTLSATSVDIVVYLSPSVRENKDGAMTWHITVATEPDVLSTYEAEITINMTITMSDVNVYNVSGTADGDNQYIDTSIPYVEGVDISNLQATATSSNENYTISEVIFTGMYNLLNLENDGTE